MSDDKDRNDVCYGVIAGVVLLIVIFLVSPWLMFFCFRYLDYVRSVMEL